MFQIVEYCRAFLVGRRPGQRPADHFRAFGVFRRDALLEVGGFADTVGEDMELVVRLHRSSAAGRPYQLVFRPDPVCWTEVPESSSRAGPPAQSLAARALRKPVAEPQPALQPARRLGGLGGVSLHGALRVSQPDRGIFWMGVFRRRLPLGRVDVKIALAFLLVNIGFGTLLSASSLLLDETSYHTYPRPKQISCSSSPR